MATVTITLPAGSTTESALVSAILECIEPGASRHCLSFHVDHDTCASTTRHHRLDVTIEIQP